MVVVNDRRSTLALDDRSPRARQSMDSKHEEGRPFFFQGRYGNYMEIIWKLYGIYMGIIWKLYGNYMEIIWTLYEIIWKICFFF